MNKKQKITVEKEDVKEIIENKDKSVELEKKVKEEVDKKPEIVKKEIKKIKKTKAFVNALNAHISTKYSIEICRFIKGKKIDYAISLLEDVTKFKRAVPMRGESPHRKGKGISSGRYPQNASNYFIKLLKSLSANANINGLENPIIVEAIANLGSRPYGRFGSIKRKRTNIILIAKEKDKGEKA